MRTVSQATLAFRSFGRFANLTQEPPVLRETRHTDAPTDVVERQDISDGTTWVRTDDFYSTYFAAVGVPEWPGRNLDAVWDSLTGGDINQRNLPYRVRIKGTSRMSPVARELVGGFLGLVQQGQQAGHSVEVELLP